MGIQSSEGQAPLSAAEWGLDRPCYSKAEAFRLIGVRNTAGFELIKAGELDVVEIGHGSITTRSIVRLLNKRMRNSSPSEFAA